MKAFKARYEGTCCFCPHPIFKQQLMVWNRSTKGQYAHATCFESNHETFPAVATPAVALSADAPAGDLASIIAQAIQPLVKGSVDENQVQQICQNAISEALADFEVPAIDEAKLVELIQAHTTKRIEVVNPKGEVKNVGRQHKQFEELLTMCNARDDKGNRLNIWITGAAGTGKTTAAQKVAEVLGLEFSTTGSLTDCYTQIFGYPIPQTGEVFKTLWRERWINGGVFVLDDFDGSDPIEAIKMNTATANGHCPFPDVNAPRHPDFILILTANTFGLGGTSDYVGRVKQDAAFLDRFVTLTWDIDEQLEKETCSRPDWVKRVQSVRSKVKAKGIRVLVTPRASYYGAALLNAGMSQDKVEAATLRKAMTADQWEQVC
jgi:cobaltochelatase CobS